MEPLVVYDLRIPAGRVVALAVALVAIAGIGAFFRWTRTGLALRALADDQEVALAMGIDVRRHLAIAWGDGGSARGGRRYALDARGRVWGFGLVLLGLKVFPIVVIGGLDSLGGASWARLPSGFWRV